MKRVCISVGILCFMIILSVFFCIRISYNCDNLIAIVESTEFDVRNGNVSSALRNAEKFEKEFEKFHKESMLMIRGEKLSDIENCYIRIASLIETGNDELIPELEKLKNTLIHLKKSEMPLLSNIL